MTITAMIACGVDPPFNNNDKVPCAAGDHCLHLTSCGIVQLENLSTRQVLECKRRIHCALFCGYSVAAFKGGSQQSQIYQNRQYLEH